jgi:uncharacterized membrane protein YgcG
VSLCPAVTKARSADKSIQKGRSFIFANSSPKLLEIFGRFFRHSNAQSFVRQLNVSLLSCPRPVNKDVDFETTCRSVNLSTCTAFTFQDPLTDSDLFPLHFSTTDGFTRLTTLDMLAAIDSSPHPDCDIPSSEFSAFSHPDFFRSTLERPCNLVILKPRATKKRRPTLSSTGSHSGGVGSGSGSGGSGGAGSGGPEGSRGRSLSSVGLEGLNTRRPLPY